MHISCFTHFPCSSVGKASASNVGDLDSIPGSGSSPGKGNGNPLQYSCLGNPMDRGTWQGTVLGIAGVGHNLALSFFLLAFFLKLMTLLAVYFLFILNFYICFNKYSYIY